MRLFVAVVAVGLLCAICAPLSAQITVLDAKYRVAVGLDVPGSRVDWGQQAFFITVQNQSPSSMPSIRIKTAARERALAEAKRVLVSAIGRIKLTGDATVADAFTAHILPKDALSSLTARLKPVVERWDANTRTLTLICALPLCEAGSPNELAAKMLQLQQQAATATGAPPVHDIKKVKDVAGNAPQQIATAPFTGLIIDCTGTGYTPVLLPKLIGTDGMELWGTQGINSLEVMNQGLIKYETNLRDALASKRIGPSPMIIRPIALAGAAQGDLVLRPEDVAALIEQEGEQHFLSSLAVIILID